MFWNLCKLTQGRVAEVTIFIFKLVWNLDLIILLTGKVIEYLVILNWWVEQIWLMKDILDTWKFAIVDLVLLTTLKMKLIKMHQIILLWILRRFFILYLIWVVLDFMNLRIRLSLISQPLIFLNRIMFLFELSFNNRVIRKSEELLINYWQLIC